jgi:CPA2 family monovalent cation:H+ antiporter-2
VVIVGYGEVGRRITKTLMEQNIKVVIAEENREIVEKLRKKGIAAVSGEATEPSVLIQAHIMHARLLVIITRWIFSTFIVLSILPNSLILKFRFWCAESKEEAEVIRRIILVKFLCKEEMAKNMSIIFCIRLSWHISN